MTSTTSLKEYQMIRINHQVSFKKLLVQNSGTHINKKLINTYCFSVCTSERLSGDKFLWDFSKVFSG